MSLFKIGLAIESIFVNKFKFAYVLLLLMVFSNQSLKLFFLCFYSTYWNHSMDL